MAEIRGWGVYFMLVLKNLEKNVVSEEMNSIYSYKLVKGEKDIKVGFNSDSYITYGIEIERRDYSDDELVRVERELCENISPIKEKVNEFMIKLYSGVVSPYHLIDILGEEIDESVYDFN